MSLVHFDFDDEPLGVTYAALLSEGLRHCRHGMLVVRDPRCLDASGVAVLDRLTPFMVERRKTSAWPGTRLTLHTADVYTFAFDRESVRILLDVAQGLYAWQHPLPEDLALLRGPSNPWLVTVGHERFAYLRLRQNEADEVRAAIAPIALRYVGEAGDEPS